MSRPYLSIGRMERLLIDRINVVFPPDNLSSNDVNPNEIDRSAFYWLTHNVSCVQGTFRGLSCCHIAGHSSAFGRNSCRLGMGKIVSLLGMFWREKRVAHRCLLSRHHRWQSGLAPFPGRGALPPGEHPEIMRLVLTHFVASLPDILSARAAERVCQQGERAPLLQRQVMWHGGGAESQ